MLANGDNAALRSELVQRVIDPANPTARFPKATQNLGSSDSIIAAELALPQKKRQNRILDGLRVYRKGNNPPIHTHDSFVRQDAARRRNRPLLYLAFLGIGRRWRGGLRNRHISDQI